MNNQADTGTVHIQRATVEDAAVILALQRLAYRSEAALYPGVALPPLTQTLEAITAEFGYLTFLKAVAGGQTVGSVRARLDRDTCHVSRLIVRPESQGQGIGTRLMRGIEAALPQAERFELFTGHRSEGNMRLYGRLGYTETRREVVTHELTLVFLEKQGASGRPAGRAGVVAAS